MLPVVASSTGGGPLRRRLGLESEPSIGFGVAVSNIGECKLAVRYPWLNRDRAPHLEELTKLARDEIDVDWTGPINVQNAVSYWFRQECRPLRIGASVADKNGTAGSVCAFVRRGGGSPELLSCSHVLANCGRAPLNATILQPGPSDGGGTTHSIGHLAHPYVSGLSETPATADHPS